MPTLSRTIRMIRSNGAMVCLGEKYTAWPREGKQAAARPILAVRVSPSSLHREFVRYAYKTAQPGVTVLLETVRRNEVRVCAVGIGLLVGIVHRNSGGPQAGEQALGRQGVRASGVY